MSTVVKTLKLLNYFSASSPELGLTKIVKLSHYDKASTHRRLTELVKTGFLDQDPVTKAYHLGAAIPRLALVREQTFPASAAAMRVLERLYEKIQETVHVSIIQGTDGLSTLAHIDDKNHGNRVYIEPADILPFHATASGLVVLAHAEDNFRETILAQTLNQITTETETNPDVISLHIEDIRRSGFGRCEGGYEADINGIAAPLFDRNGKCCGAVAAATPKSRMTDEQEVAILNGLIEAASEITSAWGGQVPKNSLQAWGRK